MSNQISIMQIAAIKKQVNFLRKLPPEPLAIFFTKPSGSAINSQCFSRSFVLTETFDKLSMSKNSSLLSLYRGHGGKLVTFPTTTGSFLVPEFGSL